MCFDTTARPPLPPIAGGAGIAASGALELRAADGNRLMAFSATTAESQAPGIVILPDVRGLHSFYTDLAERFARPASRHRTRLRGRTAGMGIGTTSRGHVSRRRPMAWLPTAAPVAHVHRQPEGAPVGTRSASVSAANTFNQAARGHGLGADRVPRCAQRSGDDGERRPCWHRVRVQGPQVLGGTDRDPTGRSRPSARRWTTRASSTTWSRTIAPHSFFDRSFAEHRVLRRRVAADVALRQPINLTPRPGWVISPATGASCGAVGGGGRGGRSA
jgi:carboxymethylenebutenolidase